MDSRLELARKYEIDNEKKISITDRPCFHLSSRVGWMNDPNGFSYYNNQYHMFYQYHPYNAAWGPMHWGHAVSFDLLKWEYKPAVLAPDKDYDSFGCFSGTAMEDEVGQHLLIYTGVMSRGHMDGVKKEYQQQCLAIGDGENYIKYESNPVISTGQIPEGYSLFDFRDPKIWRGTDGDYRCIIGAKDKYDRGQILQYKSKDGFCWKFVNVFVGNDGKYGEMWECPDFFLLDGKAVVIVSPQNMLAEGFEYHNGNNTMCIIGDYKEDTDTFVPQTYHALDYGIDFYAPETAEGPDGRRIMIGWMQNWDATSAHDIHAPYFGQMSLPRELKIVDNRLYQFPIKELEARRRNLVEYKDVMLSDEAGEIVLKGIEGRTVDLEVEILPDDIDNMYDKVTISMARNDTFHTDFTFRPKESLVEIDRSFSGSGRDLVHQRRAEISNKWGILKARFVLDRYSVEVFLEDGRQVMSTTISTVTDAQGICFASIGKAKMNVVKYVI